MKMVFLLFISFVICQRLAELMIARKNEKWMKENGAIEYGSKHYPAMVLIHIGFLVSVIFEVGYFNLELSPLWGMVLTGFIVTQLIRVWALKSLGPFWNTKIIVLPGANIIKKGPYRFIRHPNYLIVTLELILIPVLFQAYFTAILFTLCNFVILYIRIPLEEKALKEWTGYEMVFENNRRFLPHLKANKGRTS